jgi:ABC-2 type transport system ATP-binding protein
MNAAVAEYAEQGEENSGCSSMNRAISQGRAIRSILGRSRVSDFIEISTAMAAGRARFSVIRLIVMAAGHDTAAWLSVHNLQVGPVERPVLSSISFLAHPGEIVAIVGPNGAGKTTLLECIAGLRPVLAGEVLAHGLRLGGFRQRARVFGYMPDEVTLANEGTLEVILGLSAAAPLAERLSVRPLLARRANELSRGELKRAQLCACLLEDKPVLLLDEPFAAFDPRQLRVLLPVFRDAIRGRVTLVTVHQMSTAELVASHILLLAEGKVVAFGTPAELRVLADMPGAPFEEVFLALLERGDPA